jgi:hypothetical protein
MTEAYEESNYADVMELTRLLFQAVPVGTPSIDVASAALALLGLAVEKSFSKEIAEELVSAIAENLNLHRAQ